MMKNFAMQRNLKVFMTFMFVTVTLLVSNESLAQENKIFNYKTLLEKPQDANRNANVQSMQNLVTDFLPFISLKNGNVKSFGEGDAISLETDVKSLSSISNLSKQTSKIQIVKIKLDSQTDLNSKVDLNLLKVLNNLKYVYIICPFEANESQIASALVGSIENTTIIYTAALPN